MTTTSLSDLFRGYPDAYGVYRIPGGEIVAGSKVKGEAVTVTKAVTADLWDAHIKGSQGLGIIPITKGNVCYWGAVDIDVYDIRPEDFVASLREMSLPLRVFRTKSGGAHIIAFFKEPIPAATLRRFLTDVATALGHAGVEIFPKQIRIDGETLGNWLNMPYFNSARTNRFSYDPETALPQSLAEFLKGPDPRMEGLPDWTAEKQLEKEVPQAKSEWADGPPCLQRLLGKGDRFPEGTRNTGLFNLAVFRRKSMDPDDDDAWAEAVNRDNDKYAGPGKVSEVQNILRSIRKKETGYEYTCSEPPINAVCNRPLCMTRKYGVGRSELTITGLLKIDSEPPTWVIEVNDMKVRLSTMQLTIQTQFGRAVLEQTNLMVYTMKSLDWSMLLESLLDRLQVIPMPEEARFKGRLDESLHHWLWSVARAQSAAQVQHGIPYSEEGQVFFRLEAFLRWCSEHGQREAMEPAAKGSYIWGLRELGVIPGIQKKVYGVKFRFWQMTEVERPEETEYDTVNEEVPF